MKTKEASSGQPPATSNTIQETSYRSSQVPSSPWAAEPQPVRLNLRFGDGEVLGLLILALQDSDLPRHQKRCGWRLVERWLREFVGVKYWEQVA